MCVCVCALVLLECEDDGIAGLRTSIWFTCSEFDLWREIHSSLQCLHREFRSQTEMLFSLQIQKLMSGKQYEVPSQVYERKGE